mmetsp:Transcript_34194/g.85806  ORF Transcript_34194/g.85806 Transcript_34194/m.85806 type:complete len:309 (-) Transcript_34194:341-1267(-)
MSEAPTGKGLLGSSGVRLIARHDGLAFVHKPSGLCAHPHRAPQRVRAAEPLRCPCCGRDFGSDEAWAWNSLQDHLSQSADAAHVGWREANPDGLAAEYAEERTLWHELRERHAALFPPAGDAAAAAGVRPQQQPPVVHLVHRLDRGTSGIVCVAETVDVADAVQRAWVESSKAYLVLVRGRTAAEFTVDRALTDRSTKLKTAPRREASTAFELVRTYGEGHFSLLRARLLIGGRKHQSKITSGDSSLAAPTLPRSHLCLCSLRAHSCRSPCAAPRQSAAIWPAWRTRSWATASTASRASTSGSPTSTS